MTRPWRSVHFVPASEERFVDRACRIASDVIILDLEDGVSSAAKARARDRVPSAIEVLGATRPLETVFVRINSESRWRELDVDMLLGIGHRNVVLPKALDTYPYVEHMRSLMPAMSVIPLVERLWSVLELDSMVAAMRGVAVAVGLGMEDVCASLGLRAGQRHAFDAAVQASFVVSLKGTRLPLLAPIPHGFTDTVACREEAVRYRDLGFDGQFSIHPVQVPVVSEVFSVSDADMNWARDVLGASGKVDGDGYNINAGMLSSRPRIIAAEEIMRQARSEEKGQFKDEE